MNAQRLEMEIRTVMFWAAVAVPACAGFAWKEHPHKPQHASRDPRRLALVIGRAADLESQPAGAE